MDKGEQLKYGWIRGGKTSVPVVCAAQTFTAASGKFVYMSDGAATQIDSVATIFGFLESEAQTVTAGEVLNCIIDLTAVFRIPINAAGTYAAGMIGDLADLTLSGSVQGAILTAPSYNNVVIVGGDDDNDNYVDVMMSSKTWGTGLGVA